jgi:hypothetical protein
MAATIVQSRHCSQASGRKPGLNSQCLKLIGKSIFFMFLYDDFKNNLMKLQVMAVNFCED